MVWVACRVWGGGRWAWRVWLSSSSDGTHSLCWFQWHLLHVWATVQTNCRQWHGYQSCGLAYACALWMAPVSTLVSNTTLGPGHLGPSMGSMSLLCPAPSSWPYLGSLDPGKMAITPFSFLVNSTCVTFLLLYMHVWKPDQHIEHCLPWKWACHKELVGWWGGGKQVVEKASVTFILTVLQNSDEQGPWKCCHLVSISGVWE